MPYRNGRVLKRTKKYYRKKAAFASEIFTSVGARESYTRARFCDKMKGPKEREEK
jgi:hypothetical protein